MSFLHPEFFYYMLPLIGILFFFLLTQKDPSFGFFDEAVLKKLRVNHKSLSLRQRNLIYLAVFVLLIAAMAQPVLVEGKIRVKSLDRDLIAALDISASMQTRDVYPERLGLARQKILQLMENADQERIGIMAFGKEAFLVAPPSRDLRSERFLLSQLRPESLSEPGTDFPALLEAAQTVMKDMPEKNLLVVTDGGDVADFSDAVAFARANKIKVFVLGVGTEEGGAVQTKKGPVRREGNPVISRLNPALPSLAEGTGGVYVASTVAPGDVTLLLSELRKRSEIHPGEKEEIERYGQLFILPLGLALFLLLIATSSMSPRRRIEVPHLFLLGVLFAGWNAAAHAAMFDYTLLDSAKERYQAGDYDRAAIDFYRYGKRNDNIASLYNSAHALYREGHYKSAASLWNKLHTKDRILQYRILHNLGNAYAMQGGEANLEAAVKAYEKALQLKEDAQTRENLERVRGRLMKKAREKMQKQAQNGKKKRAGSGSSEPAEGRRVPGAQSQVQKQALQQEGASTNAGSGGQNAPSPKEVERKSDKTAAVKRVQPGSGEMGSETNLTLMGDLEAQKWFRRLEREREAQLYKIPTPESKRRSNDAVDPW